jgi:hypothetical protein
MTEISPDPPAGTEPGFFPRLEDRVLPHAQHAEAGAAAFAADVSTALRDHAATVLRGTADAMDVLRLIDPADADLFAEAEALVPRLLGMAESAARIAGAALKSG